MKGLLPALLAATLLSLGATAKEKPDALRVMTFNVRIQAATDEGVLRWDARKAGCVKAIEKQKPDVLGLQEAFFAHKSYLDGKLDDYQIVDRGEKPGQIGEDGRYNQNPILFRTDRLELLDYGFFWLNEDQAPDRKGWDAAYVRNVTWVKLKIRKSGKVFYYFNTHLDDQGKTARAEGAALLAEKIREIAGEDAIIFLGGDFNTVAGDNALAPLGGLFKEVKASLKKPDKTPTFNNFGKKDGTKAATIDLLYFRGAKVKDYDVCDEKYKVRYISDHYPAVADFTL